MTPNITRLTITIDIEQDIAAASAGGTYGDRLARLGTRFPFELCRKQTQLGELPIDQWWMRKRGLYGERGEDSPNRQAVVDLYWALCLIDGSAMTDRGPQESYILATLLPHARSGGSRRVFADASLTRDDENEDLDRVQIVAQLESMLKTSKTEGIDVLQFYGQTGNVLGPPEYGEQVWNCYREYAEELLGDTCSVLYRSETDGLQLALDRWREKLSKIGRRSGHAMEKSVLDILSYECRAAFHRCYSAVWLRLLEQLAAEHNLSDESVLFHRLWHLDQVIPSNETADANIHMFHGHVFGLHPAAGDFICTRTGSELTGEMLLAPSDTKTHERFLHGMLIAIYDYARRNQVCKELRKKEPDLAPDIGAIEGQQVQRRSGRRPSGRRDTDAR